MQVEVIETTGGNIFNQLLFSISSLIPLVMYGLIIYILILIIKCLKLYIKKELASSFLIYLASGMIIVNANRLRFKSTDSTHTLTMSPTEATSIGCLTNPFFIFDK